MKRVGVTGFEPATTWSQTRCATGLRYAPKTFAKLIHFLEETKFIFSECGNILRERRGRR